MHVLFLLEVLFLFTFRAREGCGFWVFWVDGIRYTQGFLLLNGKLF